MVSTTGSVLRSKTVTAGITASTSQSQGNGVLVSEINEISTVGNDNDVVTLPFASPGRETTVINNGANTLQIFPASGDNLGAGVNTSVTLMPNEAIEYVAYDSTNWQVEAETLLFHAQMYDSGNTDAYVINDAGSDDQVYHTNGLVAGPLAGWSFDAGGGGSSVAISAVADGAASGVDIKVTATSHGLAVGDIISQSNLTDAAYTGIFVVKAIIDSSNYEVAAAYTATGTGTMDQAATLICAAGSEGLYLVNWHVSATAQTNNDIFSFAIHVEEVHQSSTNTQRKFGIAADIGAMGGTSIIDVGSGEHVSFMLFNESGTGNITLKNFSLVLKRI